MNHYTLNCSYSFKKNNIFCRIVVDIWPPFRQILSYKAFFHEDDNVSWNKLKTSYIVLLLDMDFILLLKPNIITVAVFLFLYVLNKEVITFDISVFAFSSCALSTHVLNSLFHCDSF